MNKKMSKKKIYIIVAILTIALIGGLVAIKVVSLNKDKNKSSSMERITVPSAKKVFMDGVVTPIDKEYIYYDGTLGEINEVKVENGNEVKKDDVLFTCKNVQITNEIATLEMQRKKLVKSKETAQKTVEEAKKAQSQKVQALGEGEEAIEVLPAPLPVSTAEVDTISDEISYVDEQINSLKGKEYKSILAPCDGVVYVGNAKANMTEPYMTIQSAGFYIDASVNEKDYEKIKLEEKVDINVLSTNNEITGTVYFKDSNPKSGSVAEAASSFGGGQSTTQLSSYPIKISPDSQENLVNGYHVQCVLKLADSKIKIPTESILTVEDEKVVFVVKDKKLTKVVVETEDEEDTDTIIKSGLVGGEEIIKAPTSTMKEGDDVE